jgi:endonuclease-8
VPEGDNILQVTRVLRGELPGRLLDRVELQDQGVLADLAGRRVESVDAHGKQMFVRLEGGWTLRVHLGLHGRWSRLHARERRPRNPTLVLVSGDTAWVCWRSYRAEAIRTAALWSHPLLARAGPDLLAEPAPIAEAVRRALTPGYAGREIGDLVMDQRVAAGIGNVYKSEVLFECRVHPRTPVHRLGEPGLAAVYEKAAAMLRLNLLVRGRSAVPLRRRETPTLRRLWVYMRVQEPCFDCETPIERILQGDMGRSTYFCPSCQAARP